MNSHLVTVEVGIEGCTSQRMQLNGLTLDQNRLKCLDAQSVQCRCTVEHNRMLFDNILQHIPYFYLLAFYHLLGRFDIVCLTSGDKFFHNERLEELDGHLLGQTALIDLKFRTYNDNGTSGIVNTLAQQVLTETSLLTLEHIRKRLERSVAGACYRTASTAVVNQ